MKYKINETFQPEKTSDFYVSVEFTYNSIVWNGALPIILEKQGYEVTLNEIKGDFSLNAIIVRTLGLILFKFLHPFPASILNEMIDLLDTPLSPKIKDKIIKNNIKYQFPDKILDFILYGFWLMIPIIQKKWFSPLLITAVIFRSIGLYYFLIFVHVKIEVLQTTLSNFLEKSI